MFITSRVTKRPILAETTSSATRNFYPYEIYFWLRQLSLHSLSFTSNPADTEIA